MIATFRERVRATRAQARKPSAARVLDRPDARWCRVADTDEERRSRGRMSESIPTTRRTWRVI